MNVPFLDLKSQYLRLKPKIDDVFADIFEHSAFICGKYVGLFEKEFAAALKAKRFVATSSGTDAVHLMLWASGIGPGSEVIVPVNTFIATAEGVSLCGATPVFVDNDQTSYNIDIGRIEEKITPRTRGRFTGPSLWSAREYGRNKGHSELQRTDGLRGCLSSPSSKIPGKSSREFRNGGGIQLLSLQEPWSLWGGRRDFH